MPPTFSNFSVQELILQGKLLLASSGKEFVKPTGILSSAAEVKKARKEAMGRLGLEFLDGDDMDLDKEFAADAETDEGVEVDCRFDDRGMKQVARVRAQPLHFAAFPRTCAHTRHNGVYSLFKDVSTSSGRVPTQFPTCSTVLRSRPHQNHY